MSNTNGSDMNGTDDNGAGENTTSDNVTRFPEGGRRAKNGTAENQTAERLSGLVEQRAGRHVDDAAPYEPVFNLPPVTKMLCFVLLAIQAVMSLLPEETMGDIIMRFGFVPGRYAGQVPFDIYAVISPVTHMFLHGGWIHVGMNVGMLMAFGTGLERRIGAKRTLLLFFASGILGAFIHAAATIILNPSQNAVPLIGASGGISGLFGAMMMMVYTRGLLGDGYKVLGLVMGVWVLVSVFFGYFGMPGESNNIAWVVHVAGFGVGLALYKPVIRLQL